MTSKYKTKKKRKSYLNIVFFTAAIAILLLLLDVGGYLSGISKFTDIFMNPIKYWSYSLSRTGSTFLKDVSSISTLRQENVSLKNRVIELDSIATEVEMLREENTLLANELKLKKENQGELIMGDIVGGDLGLANVSEIIINKGSSHGIQAGDAAVYSGYLIGIVEKISYSSSVIKTIHNSNIEIPVISEVNKTKGVLSKGDNSKLIMSKILREEKIEVGEKILTSGIGWFPKDYIVGIISEITYRDIDVEKKAVIGGFIHINDIRKVFIIHVEKS